MTTDDKSEMSGDLSPRKQAIRDLADRLATERNRWVERNAYYYEEDRRYMRFLVDEGLRVLELGCGTGQLLDALKPSHGVGIDISRGMIEIAQADYPDLEFHVSDVEDATVLADLDGPFDVIVLSDTIGSLEDCETTLASLHDLCHRDTRLVIGLLCQELGTAASAGRVEWAARCPRKSRTGCGPTTSRRSSRSPTSRSSSRTGANSCPNGCSAWAG